MYKILVIGDNPNRAILANSLLCTGLPSILQLQTPEHYLFMASDAIDLVIQDVVTHYLNRKAKKRDLMLTERIVNDINNSRNHIPLVLVSDSQRIGELADYIPKLNKLDSGKFSVIQRGINPVPLVTLVNRILRGEQFKQHAEQQYGAL